MSKKILVASIMVVVSACSDGFNAIQRNVENQTTNDGESILVVTSNPLAADGSPDRSTTEILLSYDFGQTWSAAPQIASDFQASPTAMLKSLPDQIALGSFNGIAILNMTNGTWSYFKQGTKGYGGNERSASTYDFAIDGNFYAAATRRGVNLSQDGGQSWHHLKQMDFGAPNGPTSAQIQVKGNSLYLTTLYDILISNDRGKTWSVMPFESPSRSSNQGNPTLSMYGDFFFVTDTSRGIFRSFDAGVTWQHLALPDVLPHREFVAGAVVLDARIVTWNYMGLFLSSDQGTNWRWKSTGIITSKADRWIKSVAVSSDSILVSTYSPKESGVELFLSRNNGVSWATVSVPGNRSTKMIDAIGLQPLHH